jgi:hypothetical protein
LVDDSVGQDKDRPKDYGDHERKEDEELAEGGDEADQAVLDPLAQSPEDAGRATQTSDRGRCRWRHWRVKRRPRRDFPVVADRVCDTGDVCAG